MVRASFVRSGSLLVFLVAWVIRPDPAAAKVDVMAGSAIQADEKTVNELVAAFDRKSDARRIWEEMFEYYRQLTSRHLFAEIKTVTTETGVRAESKCTGALRGGKAETGQKVTLDSWFEEVHYLIKEDGAWRLIGNAGEEPEAPRFGHAPHPLF